METFHQAVPAVPRWSDVTDVLGTMLLTPEQSPVTTVNFANGDGQEDPIFFLRKDGKEQFPTSHWFPPTPWHQAIRGDPVEVHGHTLLFSGTFTFSSISQMAG